MLKVPDHQVAGHEARGGKLGPLVDDSGNFYKPLQNDDRGSTEKAFYISFSSNDKIPNHIRRFFPKFHGIRPIEASDGSGLQPHLVLQDVVSRYRNPSVMDIKIGSRTWDPEASEEYIQKCLQKDRESTTVALGFRISGLQIRGSQESESWKPDKKLIKKFTANDVGLVLRKFVSSNASAGSDIDPNCSFASTVYGGSAGILAQLSELKEWFEDQTIFHFNACSVLIIYDKESGAEVKLVDFAHVVEGKGIIDHNFLGGLCSLMKFISDIVTCSDQCPTETTNFDVQK